MADNYLEKRYEAVFGSNKPKVKRVGHPLDDLLLRNRSIRGYNKNFVVSKEMLERVVSVNTKIASGCNRQALRFRLITQTTGADKVLECIRLGAALPELHLPFPGTEPEAFIVICSTVEDNKLVNIDMGISAQSMLLKAVEMGLNGIIIGAFNKQALQEALALPYEPQLVVAIGKSAEVVRLVPIAESNSHAYYRENGVHYVPKVQLSDLII